MTEEEFYERLETYTRGTLIEWGSEIESCQNFRVDPHDAYMNFIFWVDGDKLPYQGSFPLTLTVLKEIFCDE